MISNYQVLKGAATFMDVETAVDARAFADRRTADFENETWEPTVIQNYLNRGFADDKLQESDLETVPDHKKGSSHAWRRLFQVADEYGGRPGARFEMVN
jgi:hypothetical protein